MPALARYLLPASLVLLLLSSEIKAIARLGRPAIVAMAAGSLGIALGSIVAFFVLRPLLPADAWKSAGALTATWIGGSANLLAVAATLGLDPGTIIIVDTVVGLQLDGAPDLPGHEARGVRPMERRRPQRGGRGQRASVELQDHGRAAHQGRGRHPHGGPGDRRHGRSPSAPAKRSLPSARS